MLGSGRRDLTPEALAPVEAEPALLRRPTPALGRGFAGHGSARFLRPLLTRARGRVCEQGGYAAVLRSNSAWISNSKKNPLRQEHTAADAKKQARLCVCVAQTEMSALTLVCRIRVALKPFIQSKSKSGPS